MFGESVKAGAGISQVAVNNTNTGIVTTNIPIGNILSAVSRNWGGARLYIDNDDGMARITVFDANNVILTDTRIVIVINYLTNR